MYESEKWNKYWTYADMGDTPTRKKLFKEFEKISISKDAKILDVGCGSGTLARYWRKNGFDIIGLDISDKSLEITRNKGVNCIKGDITQRLPFDNNSFDLVYSDGLLEHFSDPEPILSEIFRVSKENILTMLPRITLYNLVANIITRPPKEYKKESAQWIELHRKFNPKSLRFTNVGPGTLLILCSKSKLL